MTPDDSLSSLRQAWRGHEPVVPPTLDEVRRRSHRLTRTVVWRNVREYAAGAVVLPLIAVDVVRGGLTGLVDVGKVLLFAGCALVLYRLHQRGRARTVPAVLGLTDAIAFHRGELVRQRDLLMSAWRWYVLPFHPGFFVMTLGRAVEHPELWRGTMLAWLGTVGLSVLITWLNRRGAAHLQRRIDGVDALTDGHVLRTTAPRRFPSIEVATMWVLRAFALAIAPLMLWHGLGLGAPRAAGASLPQAERVWLVVATLGGVAVQAVWRFVRMRRG